MNTADLVSYLSDLSIDSPLPTAVAGQASEIIFNAIAGTPSTAHSQVDISEASPDTSSEESFATAPSRATATSTASSAETRKPENTDEVVLITSNGLFLTTSRALLIEHSTFFAGLLSLPQPESGSQSIPGDIELPSATSTGLGLILAVLACADPAEKKRTSSISPMAYKYWMAIKMADLYVFGEAAICADAYDFHTFRRIFTLPILHRLDRQPILQFAFAAVTNQTGNLSDLAARTLAGEARSDVPYKIAEALQRFAPAAHDRLVSLYRRYPSAPHQFQLHLRSTMHVPNETEDFSKRCGTGRTCSAYDEYYGKWRKLRMGAADNVYQEVLAGTGGVNGYHGIRRIVERTVSCSVCASRLTRAFERAVKRFAEV